jgi:predicted nucleotidyltransferase
MGSSAYGVSNKTSDVDVYGVCVPEKTIVFPHLTGYISGFGPAPETFDVYQKHHIELNKNEYDINIYSIIKYFQLCTENNPNMIDSLFVPTRCILHMDDVGDHMRLNRHLFLSKRIFDKMRGYAFSEFKKLERGYDPEVNAKRAATVEEFGYDVKSGYHVVRLMLEAEMVLNEGDLDLEYHREQLKFVRRGGYTLEELKGWFLHKEKELTTAHTNSTLPLKADFACIRILLLECLEMHFGTLEYAREENAVAAETLEKIKKLLA